MQNTFTQIYQEFPYTTWEQTITNTTRSDVEKVLASAPSNHLEDFAALISPAAQFYLEDMAALSQKITQKRFGKTIQLYVPMYLSNTCHNVCTYCGFSMGNPIARISLTVPEVLREAERLTSLGFRHLLLVTGEDHRISTPYFLEVLRALKPHFSQISIEVQPLETEEYRILHEEGLHAVYLYQETYHSDIYKSVHPKGKKSHFDLRLEVPEKMGIAGIHKIGLGSLLGLAPWRMDAMYLAMHLQYLEHKFWQSRFSISFPRLRPAEGGYIPPYPVNSKELLQLICAYRLFNENVELALSTRENAQFRNHAFKLGITTMSAGSKTSPGGYGEKEDSLEQFAISDERSPAQVAHSIQQNGYEAIWKDWDGILTA